LLVLPGQPVEELLDAADRAVVDRLGEPPEPVLQR
jgi:hypothetical protein